MKFCKSSGCIIFLLMIFSFYLSAYKCRAKYFLNCQRSYLWSYCFLEHLDQSMRSLDTKTNSSIIKNKYLYALVLFVSNIIHQEASPPSLLRTLLGIVSNYVKCFVRTPHMQRPRLHHNTKSLVRVDQPIKSSEIIRCL